MFIGTPGGVVELPRTPTGYGPQTTLPVVQNQPLGVAVDRSGDVFISGALTDNAVVELPRTATGFGPQITLPFSRLSPFENNPPDGVAVDGSGNVFFADTSFDVNGDDSGRVVELQRAATGYETQTILPASVYEPFGVAVDRVGDVFIDDTGDDRVVELPKTATGFGSQITLPTSGLLFAQGIAVDNAGDVFIADSGNDRVVQFQTHSVSFGSMNVCAPGQSTHAPCSETLTLNFNVTSSGTLDTPKVLTGGAPDLDFTLASGSTCSGSVTAGTTCTVNVTFAPLAAGLRNGSVEITDGSGNILTTTLLQGLGQTSATIDFSQGFAQSQGSIQFNGNTSNAGAALELTDGGLNETSSAFSTRPVNVQSFTTDFTFQLTNARADGFTFTIQNAGPGALGVHGGGLGYAGIGRSVAVKFDLYQDSGDPSNNSTGIFVDGASPLGSASIDLTGSGINLHSGDLMDAHITYYGTTLYLTITDTATLATWTHPFNIDIPGKVGGNTAYVGFTGATGELASTQQILSWSYEAGQVLFDPAGFSSANGLSFNGNAALSGSSIELTTGGTNETGSAFFTTPVNVQSFTTDFDFQLTNAKADGFTFTIQNAGPTAIGAHGGSLGYTGIKNSVAIKFDLYDNAGEGPDSTGIYTDGVIPTVPSIDLTGSGIDLHSGDTMNAHITYDGTTLTLTITDLMTLANWSHPFPIDIPGTVGSNTAYVGFTGGTGGLSAVQQILDWTFE